MSKPNFFIIGAPKCGTTSLYHWLSEHPQVYMSPVKEPHFYNDDCNYGYCIDDYPSLFKNVKDHHVAVGDASVWYLYSKNAVPNIEEDNPRAKYIVMLRNPVEMVYSLHGQFLVSGDETVKDFETAWELQPTRAFDKNIPFTCRVPAFLQYHDVCCLGKQVQRLLQHVPRERVKFILLDDMKQDTRTTLLEILNFLGLDDDRRIDFPVKNRAKAPKFQALILLNKAYSSLIQRLGLRPLGTGFLTFLNKLNVQVRSRPPLSPQLRKKIADSFYVDVRLLGRILGRNLDHWL